MPSVRRVRRVRRAEARYWITPKGREALRDAAVHPSNHRTGGRSTTACVCYAIDASDRPEDRCWAEVHADPWESS